MGGTKETIKNAKFCRRATMSAKSVINVGAGDDFITKSTGQRLEIVPLANPAKFKVGEPFWGQGLIPEAVDELLRYAFEELAMRAVWCGYYEGNVKSQRAQEKCGFKYSHTEEQKPVPLLGEVRTEHFTKLTLEEWKKRRKK